MSHQPFKIQKTCVIISQSSFLSDFIETINPEIWLIKAVMSDVYSRIECRNFGIDCDPLEKSIEVILNIKPDYVFSIVNPIILPKEVLKQSICINFHPSLLPNYQGVCPTNWAIYYHEKSHGYTWHIMSEKVDQGDIIFQDKVSVSKEDTAKTLMLRCYKKAIEEFHQLLIILLKAPYYKPMGRAKYYGYNNKPNFLLDTLADNRLSSRLLRASTSIDSYNDFGVVKVYINHQFYILRSLKKQQDPDCSKILCDDKYYFAQLTSLTGSPITLQSAELSTLPCKVTTQHLACCNKIARTEQYWLKLLRDFRSPTLFSYINHSYQSYAGSYHFQCDFLDQYPLSYSPDKIIFALWCAIMTKIIDAEKVSLWVGHDFVIEQVLQPLFYNYVPFDLLTDQNQTLHQYIDKIIGQREQASVKHCFTTDLFARDSILKERARLTSFSFVASQEMIEIKCDDNHPVIFAYDCAKKTMDVHYYLPKNSFLAKALADCKGYFTALCAYNFNTKLNQISLNKVKTTPSIDTNAVLKQNPKYSYRINQLVRKNAQAAPDHIILEQGDKKYTYQALIEAASIVSNRLAPYIQPSSIVGLVLPRGYVFIKHMLAILESQAAYFPVLYDMNIEVILGLMADIGAYAFISDRDIADTRIDTKIKINDQIWFYKLKVANNIPKLSKATAYVMFTSGSTGKPKAIPIKHSNIINLCEDKWVKKVSHHKKVMHASQLSFDGSTFEMWGALLNIGTICVLENNKLLSDIHLLSKFLNDHKVNTALLPTKILELYVNSAVINHLCVQYILFGGENFHSSLFNRNVANERIQLINAYGPTENTVCASLHVLGALDIEADYPNIGRPLDNVIANIYDGHLNLMPDYIPGKLFLSGLSLFDGYLNASNTSIINHQGYQQYNSGDICYLDADNALHIIGRDDKMIKLHGYRIELKHLEQVLRCDAQVISTKAEVIDNQFNQPCLVAFILAKSLNRDIYEKNIANKLPAYMCPKYYIYLEKWPLTNHGKLNKKSLIHTFKQYLQHRNLELQVGCNDVNAAIDLFKVILNVDYLDQHDDFFKLGGDSLRLIELKIQVKALFNFELLLKYFLDQPTPYGLYQLVCSNTDNNHMAEKQDLDHSISQYCQKIDALTIAVPGRLSTDKNIILLTGASGFVGGQTLSFLCQQGYQVYCLVRPQGKSIVQKKQNIIQQCLNHAQDSSSIIFLPGDFSKEKLGLSDQNYSKLCHKVTAIIHCGCHVNHLYHYKQLELDNVFSTYELIKLASQGAQKRIIYVSSLSAALPKNSDDSIAEKIYPDSTTLDLANGYSQSKYASEILLNHAAKKGMDCIIVRPGWVVGNSQTGCFPNQKDHYSLIIRSVLRGHLSPETNFKLNFIPVDMLAQLLVQSVVTDSHTYVHTINAQLPQTIAWRKLLDYLNIDNHRIIYNTLKWQNYISMFDSSSDLFALKLLYEVPQHLYLLEKLNKIDIQIENFTSLLNTYKTILPKIYNKALILRLFGSIIHSKEELPPNVKAN